MTNHGILAAAAARHIGEISDQYARHVERSPLLLAMERKRAEEDWSRRFGALSLRAAINRRPPGVVFVHCVSCGWPASPSGKEVMKAPPGWWAPNTGLISPRLCQLAQQWRNSASLEGSAAFPITIERFEEIVRMEFARPVL